MLSNNESSEGKQQAIFHVQVQLRNNEEVRWQAPENGRLKVNVDASISQFWAIKPYN